MTGNCSHAGRARRKQEFLKWATSENISWTNFVQEFQIRLKLHFIWDLTCYTSIQNVSFRLLDQGSKTFRLLTVEGP